MPGVPLQTEAFVLLKRPASDTFQSFTVFSQTDGALFVLQRATKKAASTSTPLDLFDEVALDLESSNQGQTWFVREARLLRRHAEIGRSYDALRLASALSSLVARNTVPEESRADVAALLRQALDAFGSTARPDLVWFKSLYRFARDEGYPMKEEWFPSLAAPDRAEVALLLNQPLARQTAPPAEVQRFTVALEQYLRGHTEILLD